VPPSPHEEGVFSIGEATPTTSSARRYTIPITTDLAVDRLEGRGSDDYNPVS